MTKGPSSLQHLYLNALRKERTPVSIYLVNGIKLQGQIESFDQFVVVLRNSVNQMVYKHAISTVVPAQNVRLPSGDQRGAGDHRGSGGGQRGRGGDQRRSGTGPRRSAEHGSAKSAEQGGAAKQGDSSAEQQESGE